MDWIGDEEDACLGACEIDSTLIAITGVTSCGIKREEGGRMELKNIFEQRK